MIGDITAHHRIVTVITGQERRHDMRTMKRFGRIFLNTLTAISLLLAIATAGLWVRSVFAVDSVLISFQKPIPSTNDVKLWDYYIGSGWGNVWLARGTVVYTKEFAADEPKPFVVQWRTDSDRTLIPLRQRIIPPGSGFALETTGMFKFRVPYWALMISVVPFVYGCLALHRRVRRLGAGCCPACGYDMRANPAKCSECGQEMKLAGDGGDVR